MVETQVRVGSVPQHRRLGWVTGRADPVSGGTMATAAILATAVTSVTSVTAA